MDIVSPEVVPAIEQIDGLPKRDVVVSKVIPPTHVDYQKYPLWQQEKLKGGYPIVETFVAANGKKIEYLGVEHSNDPQNPQMDGITKRLSDFTEGIKPEDIVVFYEGGVGPLSPQAFEGEERDGVIKKYTEAGLLSYEAVKRGIRVEGIEPHPMDLNLKIKESNIEGVTDETLAISEAFKYLVSQISINQGEGRPDPSQMTEKELFGILREVSITTGWRDEETKAVVERLRDGSFTDEQKLVAMQHFVDENCALLNAELQKQIGKDFIVGNKAMLKHEDMYDYLDPGKDSTVFNKISQRATLIRDQVAAGKIYDAVNSGKNVFVAAGDSHLFRTAPALEAMSSKT